mmetsp:Transcript_2551/g.5368  ORF Transcript_2551/g.5368 Transcript_2551/m.5368 type:complete len:198 (-) Transcript_2551:117-710(-)
MSYWIGKQEIDIAKMVAILRGSPYHPLVVLSGGGCHHAAPAMRSCASGSSSQREPRIHFALTRGTVSSPKLRVYHEATLEEELEEATREYLAEEVQVSSRAGVHTLRLPHMFKNEEFGAVGGFHLFSLTPPQDFGKSKKEIVAWLQRYADIPDGVASSSLLRLSHTNEDRRLYLLQGTELHPQSCYSTAAQLLRESQ